MAFEVNTGSTSVEFGATLQISFRQFGSGSPFTPIAHFPGYNELPYTFNMPSAGVWEIQYAQICASCSGSKYSAPETVQVTVS